MRFSSKSDASSTWRDLNSLDLIGVLNLCHWLALIAIPEVDWRSLAARHQLEFIIFPLAHTIERSVERLVSIHPLLFLQVIGRHRLVHRAGMNLEGLIQVGEQADDVLLLVYMNEKLKC